jgi:hypothetical protein
MLDFFVALQFRRWFSALALGLDVVVRTGGISSWLTVEYCHFTKQPSSDP